MTAATLPRVSVVGLGKLGAPLAAVLASRGFKVIGTYWTQGQYDLVSIVEAPDEESMTAGLFNNAETGNVHSETLRAWDESEMSRALAKA